MLPNVLQDIAVRQKEHTSDIGVIFDEYDASNLAEEEARNLDKSLLEMEDSYVLILCQSDRHIRFFALSLLHTMPGAKAFYNQTIFP